MDSGKRFEQLYRRSKFLHQTHQLDHQNKCKVHIAPMIVPLDMDQGTRNGIV